MQGVQGHPQKFSSIENLGKIPENPGKIYENVRKIPENTGKNAAQRCLLLKNWRPTCAESHEDLF